MDKHTVHSKLSWIPIVMIPLAIAVVAYHYFSRESSRGAETLESSDPMLQQEEPGRESEAETESKSEAGSAAVTDSVRGGKVAVSFTHPNPDFDRQGNFVGKGSRRASTHKLNARTPSDVGQFRHEEFVPESEMESEPLLESKNDCKAPNRDLKKIKSSNAYAAAHGFLKRRRCNSFMSGPRGEAIKVLSQARVTDFCQSDYKNALEMLRQVGHIAGKQDVDEHNDFEKWIDCFCNVTGKNICPPVKMAKPRDEYDIQEPFEDPAQKAKREISGDEGFPAPDANPYDGADEELR